MAREWSVFIRRLNGGGFVVREGPAAEYYEPDLRRAMKRTEAALAEPGESDHVPSEVPDAVETAYEQMADQVIAALDKLDGAHPDDDATIALAGRLIQDISRPRTVPADVESRIIQMVKEKMALRRLLDAPPYATRRRRTAR